MRHFLLIITGKDFNYISFTFRYNILTGLYPFEGDNIYRLLENIGRKKWIAPDWLEEKFADLLTNMLKSEPKERYSLQQVKKHP